MTKNYQGDDINIGSTESHVLKAETESWDRYRRQIQTLDSCRVDTTSGDAESLGNFNFSGSVNGSP